MTGQAAKIAVPRQARAKASVAQAKPSAMARPQDAVPGLDYTADTGNVTQLFPGQVAALARAVQRGTPQALPQVDRLSAHFDESLAEFSAVWSTEIARLLATLGAEAAVLGDRLALRSPDVSFATLLHEAAHLLQVANGGAAPVPVSEAEADIRMDAAGRVQTGAPADALLFRDARAAEDEPTQHEAAQEFRAESTATPQIDPEPVAAAPVAEATAVPPQEGVAPDALEAEAATPMPGISTELPPLSAEAEAAKEALQHSEAALSAAQTPEAYMAAFSAAVPSVKAAKTATLDADLARLADQDNAANIAAAPAFAATLHADEAVVPDIAPVAAPSGEAAPLEDGTPAAVPDPVIAPTAPVTPFTGNAYLDQWRAPADTLAAADVAHVLGQTQTSDTVETSPGPAPTVALEGEADPARADAQALAAADDAAVHRDAAMAAVVAGPGPEQVTLRAMDDPVPLDLTPAPILMEAAVPIEGQDAFLSRNLDAETTAIFDAHHAAPMQASLAEADAQMGAMVTDRDTQRDTASTKAEADMQTAETQANADQARMVGEARQGIQDQRQTTLDSQQTAVADMTADVATQNQATQDEIAARVAEDEAQVQAEYAGAEAEADAKVVEAETQAAAEKAAAEKDAEDKSWWDEAVDWVGDQLSKLADAIGGIFDAIRKGIGAILDAVKSVAFAIIDAAASFVKGAIAVFGEVLKFAVNTLIGSVFPELAAELNALIDEGVALAQSAVDLVADGLKAAVSFVVDAYKAALNAILSFVEGALKGLLAIAKAALTGDWAEVARLILEPILSALGINKDDFYAFVGNALAAIGNIIDDPIGFLGNLLAAVVGGFQRFADNFKDHLIAGIIGWLTGAFAGAITIPAQFDLMGVLDIARQILGLTLDMVRKVAVRIIGEAAVAKIEFFIGYASTLITQGWGAFFDQIKGDLSNLASMVMGQITAFLVERVVKAGIVWLASLINPAGALLKLVLMIWDFIMWLKDNLSRLIDIVRTIVQGMIDISNGVIEPAAKAIEGVLARLIPPAIDLLARLLGLGNVAAYVKDIITGIHKRIEDAIVALIQKVLAKFAGGGGAAAAADPATAASGLMAPVSFGTAEESHTLYAEEHGADVVPMMRSTPMAVETWLIGLKTEAGVKAQLVKSTPGVMDATVTERTAEIAPLVALALTTETKMDADGEGAQDAEKKMPTASADEKAKLDASAKVVAKALTDILKKLGLTDAGDFRDTFNKDIAKTVGVAQAVLNDTINSRINADLVKKVAYSDLTWADVAKSLAGDTTVLTQGWVQPFHAGGILRAQTDFVAAIVAAAKAHPEANKAAPGNPDTAAFLGTDLAIKAFMTDHFLPATSGASRTRAVALLLAPDGGWGTYVTALTPEIATAVTGYFTKTAEEGPDAAFKATVKAASFREGGIFETKAFLTLKLPYFREQDAQGQGVAGTEGGQYDLGWFLNRVPPGSSAGSSRAQKNVTYTADMVRAAEEGMHEWILASQANEAIAASVRQLESEGGTKNAEGVANFVYFMHVVRTDTSDIIFDPAYAKRTNEKRVAYLSPAHLDLLGKAKPGDAGYDEKLKSAYTGLPAMGASMPALQAHAGGLFATQLKADGSGVEETGSWAASPQWHEELRTKVSAVLGQAEALTVDDMSTLGDAFLETFEETTLSATDEAAMLKQGDVGFALYRLGSTKITDFDVLIAEAIARHLRAATQLQGKIQKVVNYTKGIPT